MIKLFRDLSIGLGVLLAAGAVFLFTIELAGIDIQKGSEMLQSQGNRGLLPIRLLTYAVAIWWLPKQAGLGDTALQQTRILIATLAGLIELVAVQQTALF